MIRTQIDLKIEQEKCIRCGLCVNECQNRAIEMDPETNYPRVTPEKGDGRCMHCRHCMMICPSGALSMDGLRVEDCLPPGKYPSYDELVNLVRNRRSFRYYKQKNVDRAVLAELMDAMRYVPTGKNDHRLHFSLIDDIEVMNAFRNKTYAKICDIFGDETKEVPEKFKPYAHTYYQYKNGQDPIFRTAPHVLFVSVPANAPTPDADPLIAVSYFELLAQARGIATVWFGRILMMYRAGILPDFLEPFRIPEGYIPGYAILFGESDLEFKRIAPPDPIEIYTVTKNDI